MISNIAGYAGFKSYGDKHYSAYKPGQTQLERDYYKDATHEKPDGVRQLQNFGRFQSVYGENVSETVKPTDYKVPSKDTNTMINYEMMHNTELMSHTRLGKLQELERQQAGMPASTT
jgi:phosphomannomutase